MSIQFVPLVRCAAAIAVCFIGLCLNVAQAQTAPDASDTATLYANAQHWLDETLSNGSGKLPLRMEVTVGELDRRLKLAACERVEPYIPPGSQLWGKTRLGLRCVQGVSRWNVFLPITVKALARPG